jgi:hypothetical protein
LKSIKSLALLIVWLVISQPWVNFLGYVGSNEIIDGRIIMNVWYREKSRQLKVTTSFDLTQSIQHADLERRKMCTTPLDWTDSHILRKRKVHNTI